MSFSELGLCAPLLQAANGRPYKAPTPIQKAIWAAVVQGQDVLACAPTGSGKTAAYVLPLLERHLQAPHAGTTAVAAPKKELTTLVLVPTRELAIQVGRTFYELTQRLEQAIKVTVVFGGVSINPQMMGLRGGTHVLVATPGRLLDLLSHNAVHLTQLRTLVLDEADRLLHMGFRDELNHVLTHVPPACQLVMASATFDSAVTHLAQTLLRNPFEARIEPQHADAPEVLHHVMEVDAPRRTQLLRHLIEERKWRQVLVFVGSQYTADTLSAKLRKARFSAEPLHAGLSQGKRMQVLADFKAGRVKVLVATDLAARGIDVVGLPVVVNFDLARNSDDHTHRMGRTGRAGASGTVINLVSHETDAHLRLLEKRQGAQWPREQVAGFEPTQQAAPNPSNDLAQNAPDRPENGGIKGRRPSKKDKLRQAATLAVPRVTGRVIV